MATTSLKSIGAYSLVLVGVAAVVVLSALSFHPSHAGAASRVPASSDTAPLSASALSGGSACSLAPASPAMAEVMRQSQLHGRALLNAGNLGEALSLFRSVAAADSGLPGINLDLSTALLKQHQTEAAKIAVNAQLATSDCLQRLTPEALESYCKARLSHATTMDCRQELASVERSAHFQSALVQMELANGLSDDPTPLSVPGYGGAPHTKLSSNPQRSAGSSSKPALKLLALAHPSAHPETTPAKVKVAAPHRAISGNPLAAGAGTDAALGAYSK